MLTKDKLKCLQDVVDEQFQLTGKRFCIDFFENGGPKQYLSLEKNMEPIGESWIFTTIDISLKTRSWTFS